MARMHNPPHPGELIKASINEFGNTVTAFAEHIGVSRVLNGRASVTAMLDYRVAAAFGQTPGLWLRMQTAYDLWKLEYTRLPKIKRLAA